MSQLLKRFWRYRYSSWQPRWWNYLLPYPGGDEWGRLTLVFHVPPIGFIVWAYKTCHCDVCVESREWTANNPYQED